jgi:hypothetical protein
MPLLGRLQQQTGHALQSCSGGLGVPSAACAWCWHTHRLLVVHGTQACAALQLRPVWTLAAAQNPAWLTLLLLLLLLLWQAEG